MSAREEFISTMQEAHSVMEETEEAFLRYIRARDEANSAFCLFSNKFGMTSALVAKEEAVGGSK